MSLIIFSTAAAQTNGKQKPGEIRQMPSAEQMAQRRTEKMTKMLSLDDKQKERVYKLSLKTMRKQQEAREKMRKLMREAEAAGKEFDSSLKEILTPEQMLKYNESKKEQGKAQGKKMKKGMPCCKYGQCACGMKQNGQHPHGPKTAGKEGRGDKRDTAPQRR